MCYDMLLQYILMKYSGCRSALKNPACPIRHGKVHEVAELLTSPPS
jgi:hypothetical protein